MDALDRSTEEQRKTLLIAELGELHPVAFFDSQEQEHDLLAHSSVISKLTSSQSSQPDQRAVFMEIPPAKRARTEALDLDDEYNCASLFHLISASTLSRHLKVQDYVEMDDTIAAILNTDWTRRRWMRVICARAMEGLILVNGTQGLLVNCAEVYSRQPSLDAHYERTFQKHNQPQVSTLPDIDTKYNNVQLFTVDSDNSKKLELGTRTMNVLFTSTLRLDKHLSISIGPSSANDFSALKSTMIFVRKGFMPWYQGLVAGDCTNLILRSLYPFDEFSQLRQVRSKYDKATTYLLACSSSPHTNDICHRPITIWTLADQDTNTSRDSDGKNASLLFQAIAMAVWDDGEAGKLNRKVVDRLSRNCKASGKVLCIMNNIAKLYDTDSVPLTIIGNQELNRQLVTLADLLVPYITNSNTEIASSVRRLFQK